MGECRLMMNRLARDVATNKQKWAIELCEEYATDETFDWKHGTVSDMQRFLDRHYEAAKEEYHDDFSDWIYHDEYEI